MPYFIDVILPIPVARLFTYEVSEEQYAQLSSGIRVAVPFGNSKVYSALVYRAHDQPPQLYEAKSIEQILDDFPIVTPDQLKHWEWVAAYYLCTLGEVFRAAVPGVFLLESETLIFLSSTEKIDESQLSDNEFLIYEALQRRSVLKIHEIRDILDRKRVLPILQNMMRKNIITLKEEVFEIYTPKMVRFVRLNASLSDEESLHTLLDSLSRAPKQREVMMTYFSIMATSKKPIRYSELMEKSGVSTSVMENLIAKEILVSYYERVDRIASPNAQRETAKELSDFQEDALDAINGSFKEKEVVLLHGVTSSGKTEVYVKLIEQAIATGKQVLYLLPEIALTTQLIERLQRYFAERVSVYHSRYSGNERAELWNKVLKKDPRAQVVLGARSSLFLPFNDLGLVIVDEEHEPSYKQFDPAPRYHARDSAIVLAQLFGAKTLLGSATPSVESRYNAQQGKYGYVTMDKRYGEVQMPEIQLVHLGEKMRKKQMKGHFSDILIKEIERTLEGGEQVILFQNRRGYAPVVECRRCGFAPQCPNCDVSLTYHQYRDQLRCHYCGYHVAMEQLCWVCGSNDLDTKGFGTQQIEQELRELFPKAKVGRMDMDTTRGKQGYNKVIGAFEAQETDILVGTQMLTKGLDFRNVRLVGVMHADALLNYPDFRSQERTFQLLQQVAGRAGRTKEQGLVVVQTYRPSHPVIQQMQANDYHSLFTEELKQRKAYQYPPFNRIIRITLMHKDYDAVNRGAAWLAQYLRNGLKEHVLGPEFPLVARVRNRYLKNILVKIPAERSLSKVKDFVKRGQKSFSATPNFKKVKLVIDVDCY